MKNSNHIDDLSLGHGVISSSKEGWVRTNAVYLRAGKNVHD